MRYVWKPEAPCYVPCGYAAGFKRRADAQAAVGQESGCGLRSGMRAVRYRVTDAEWRNAK